ncbi:hypothetical protein DAPPUDRAFT_95669 [Daphnia pulex]|uniref:Uncharacterized protein n=1 Tax=Daphnia pulex TaxID=6669 RepID=E9FUE4_DAPPU|nr:hypothetical protein DAPPUDRAFT_95669 [Daphnia pulex]|eukprot:EFX88713.1 hypothetical protein DAPPUDRAFT_95669 [Daphnia pulex]
MLLLLHGMLLLLLLLLVLVVASRGCRSVSDDRGRLRRDWANRPAIAASSTVAAVTPVTSVFVVFPESCNGRAPKRNGRPTGRRSEQQRRCATDCRKWKKKKTKKKKKKGKTCDTQAHFKLETVQEERADGWCRTGDEELLVCQRQPAPSEREWRIFDCGAGAIPSVIISSDLHAPVHGINPDTQSDQTTVPFRPSFLCQQVTNNPHNAKCIHSSIRFGSRGCISPNPFRRDPLLSASTVNDRHRWYIIIIPLRKKPIKPLVLGLYVQKVPETAILDSKSPERNGPKREGKK